MIGDETSVLGVEKDHEFFELLRRNRQFKSIQQPAQLPTRNLAIAVLGKGVSISKTQTQQIILRPNRNRIEIKTELNKKIKQIDICT